MKGTTMSLQACADISGRGCKSAQPQHDLGTVVEASLGAPYPIIGTYAKSTRILYYLHPLLLERDVALPCPHS